MRSGCVQGDLGRGPEAFRPTSLHTAVQNGQYSVKENVYETAQNTLDHLMNVKWAASAQGLVANTSGILDFCHVHA